MTPVDEQLRTLLERAAPSSAGVDFAAVASKGRRFQRRRRLAITASIAVVAVAAGSLTAAVVTSDKSGVATVSPNPSGGGNATYQLTPVNGVASDAGLQSDADMLTRRLAAAGINGKAKVGSGGIALEVPASAASTVGYLIGTGRLGFRVPGVEEPARGAVIAKTGGCSVSPGPLIGDPPPCITAQLGEVGCPKAGSADLQTIAAAPATDWIIACDTAGSVEYALSPERLSGHAISGAKATIQTGVNGTATGQWVVEVDFNSAARRAWSDLTDAISSSPGCPASTGGPNTASPPVTCQLAMVVDGIVMSAPVIEARITGSAEITGNFTEQAARALAAALGTGPLPVPLTVGPPLGGSYSGDGGTFRYPNGTWWLSNLGVPTSFSAPVAYLSNYPLNAPCPHLQDQCTPATPRLGPGGVLIIWDIYGFPGYDITKAAGSATTIDGRQARIHIGPALAPSACAAIGASAEVDVIVAMRPHSDSSFWRMTGCMVDQSSLGTVLAVARSLHLAAPAPS